ncbi:glycosyltransferase family 32 protein [Lacinutrix undariae]
MMIPKIIHYCWYGDKPIPKRLQYCIDSWRIHLVEYQFMLWNEDNTDFDCAFIEKAYKEKKWAFVSDYVRLKSVYEHGGIYLDTDMLLLKPVDYFLNKECFFVAEHTKSIGVGIFGAIKNNLFIEKCLRKYQREIDSFIPIPKIVSDTFIEEYNMNNVFDENIDLNQMIIYKSDYFYALPFGKLFDIHHYKKYLTQNSYGVHLWEGSWHNYNELILLRRQEYNKAFKRIYISIFKEHKMSKKYLIKVVIAFKDSLLTPNAFK